MLLRSSSTPILGSLLSSSQFFSEIPINAFQHHPSSLERTTSSPSFLRAISCRISPISDPSDLDPSTAIRRTRSEGNINGLLHQKSPKPPSSTGNSFLEQAPKTEEDQMGHDKQPNEADVSFLSEKQIPSVDKNAGQRVHWAPQPLFLARGLGIDRLGSGFLNLSGNGSDFVGTDGQDGIHTVKTKYGGEGNQIEAYYKRMVEDNPTNPMILRNYAQFLYQCKGDLHRAEEYYSRAILVDPGDADTVSQYGKLVWELHHDYDRASSYLERAANLDQTNSFVQAAYASFLWETCEEEAGEENKPQEINGMPLQFGPLTSAST
ncbi:hypothetical protein HPP92_022478 [Vanilla planifolia]|uniref:TmcB/TmcC TPR repeats domain-containing protein n=1 Tax=Vanilla planifolia TaxID=51239 RepID=A0A835PS32_VANPL|nr:hypothetical protein HPP92_022478 [Vanilla planifolia]